MLATQVLVLRTAPGETNNTPTNPMALNNGVLRPRVARGTEQAPELPLALLGAYALASPRIINPPTPWRSVMIHAAVLSLWAVSVAAAFTAHGLWVWATGLVYTLYDTSLLGFNYLSARRLGHASTHSAARAGSARIGVIVAAYNEACVLPQTIESLLRQCDASDEIVIADDGSDDDTAQVLAALHSWTQVRDGHFEAHAEAGTLLRWLRLPHGGKARALNAALLWLQTDVVVTVDADTRLEAGALSAMRRAFDHEPDLVAATGVLTPHCGPAPLGRVLQAFQTYEYVRNFLSRYAWMRQDALLLISGAFAGFRREGLVSVGGFDEDCLVEDYELIHRLRRHAGRHALLWTTRVLGEARARTDAPANFTAFVRQRQRWFGGFLQTQCWYRDMVGSRRYGRVGTRMLPVKAVDTVQPLFSLSAWIVLVASLLAGRLDVVKPVLGMIAAKMLIDGCYMVWALRAYRRWIGVPTATSLRGALLAVVAEPFSFQILRHVGATAGWVRFLTGTHRWGRQTRLGRD